MRHFPDRANNLSSSWLIVISLLFSLFRQLSVSLSLCSMMILGHNSACQSASLSRLFMLSKAEFHDTSMARLGHERMVADSKSSSVLAVGFWQVIYVEAFFSVFRQKMTNFRQNVNSTTFTTKIRPNIRRKVTFDGNIHSAN